MVCRLLDYAHKCHWSNRPTTIRNQMRFCTATVMWQRLQDYQNDTPRLGVVLVEDPTSFVSLSKGYFHLFHFLEFCVIVFAEWHGLSHSRPPPVVRWWYHRLLTRREMFIVRMYVTNRFSRDKEYSYRSREWK